MKKLGVTDRRLLDEVQRRFPVCARPYAVLGERLGLREPGVIKRLEWLKARGVIRRIGPVFDARAHNLQSILVGLSVPPARVKRTARIINGCIGVTHNYLRRHRFNIWFTLSSRSLKSRRKILDGMKEKISPREWLELPTRRVFKIGVLFNVFSTAGQSEKGGVPDSLSRRHSGKIVSPPIPPSRAWLVPFDLPLVPEPFPRGVVGDLRRRISSGSVRRFGAVLDGKALGYNFSALVAWKVGPARVERAGRLIGLFPCVSHCYERGGAKAWPFRLYTVVHARGRREGVRLIEKMASASAIGEYIVLETVRPLKRTPLPFPHLL
jgi:DNA-binding Lrp family transcriptional regulator